MSDTRTTELAPRLKAEGPDAAKSLRWRAHDIDGRGYYMENSERNVHLTHAHCKACAFVEVLQKFGGDVDLRGLHAYGACYSFLQVVVRAVREGEGAPAEDSK